MSPGARNTLGAALLFVSGLMIGLREANPVFDITEVVHIAGRVRANAFHTVCYYVEDVWKRGIANPIEADLIWRDLP